MANKRSKAKKMGPSAIKGSRKAKRIGIVLLEVLSGTRTTAEAMEALGISQTRYYLLETRALQGFIDALEPRTRGRGRSAEAELSELKATNKRLIDEVQRHQALIRAAQRSIGLPSLARARARDEEKDKSKRTRRTKPTTRAKRVVTALRKAHEEPPAGDAASTQSKMVSKAN